LAAQYDPLRLFFGARRRLAFLGGFCTGKMMTEELENLRKKLIFRSWHRGTREMDLMMGKFATAVVPSYGPEQLRAYEALMHENDPDIYNWITKQEAPHVDIQTNTALIELIAFYNKT
jgi:antitoxin CptB